MRSIDKMIFWHSALLVGDGLPGSGQCCLEGFVAGKLLLPHSSTKDRPNVFKILCPIYLSFSRNTPRCVCRCADLRLQLSVDSLSLLRFVLRIFESKSKSSWKQACDLWPQHLLDLLSVGPAHLDVVLGLHRLRLFLTPFSSSFCHPSWHAPTRTPTSSVRAESTSSTKIEDPWWAPSAGSVPPMTSLRNTSRRRRWSGWCASPPVRDRRRRFHPRKSRSQHILARGLAMDGTAELSSRWIEKSVLTSFV